MWWIDLIKKGVEDTKGAGFGLIEANQRQVDYAPFMNMFQAGGGLAGSLIDLLINKKKEESASTTTSAPVENVPKKDVNAGVPKENESSVPISSIDMMPQDYQPMEYRPQGFMKEYEFNKWMQRVMNGENYQSYTPPYAQDNVFGG